MGNLLTHKYSIIRFFYYKLSIPFPLYFPSISVAKQKSTLHFCQISLAIFTNSANVNPNRPQSPNVAAHHRFLTLFEVVWPSTPGKNPNVLSVEDTLAIRGSLNFHIVVSMTLVFRNSSQLFFRVLTQSAR